MARTPRGSGAGRASFDADKHPRAAGGRFGTTGGSAGRGRLTVGAQRLKSSGVTAADRIVVLSRRVRKYRGHDTVESFVSRHPRGRAHALRLLAADHRKGLIGFEGAAGSAAAKPAVSETRVVRDITQPQDLPRPGTPERAFHDGMLHAANVFGPGTEFSILYSGGKPHLVNIKPPGRSSFIQRTLDLPERAGAVRSIEHSLFVLDAGTRGTGQAKAFLARSVEAYQHLDLDHVSVHANIDVGGYAWLKYGFEPDDLTGRHLAAYAREQADRMHAAGAIDAATHGHVMRMLNTRDFQAAADFKGSHKIEFGGKTQSLGKHLFVGSNWHGKFDLRSRFAMARFRSYVSDGA